MMKSEKASKIINETPDAVAKEVERYAEEIMKNTIENKEKLFCQYWGQKVYVDTNDDNEVIYVDRDSMYIPIDKEDYLLLKPLSSISNEDAIRVAKLYRWYTSPNLPDKGWRVRKNDYGHTVVSLSDSHWEIEVVISKNGIVWSNETTSSNIKSDGHYEHYLRSKGYGLPFQCISVEDQVKFGWVLLEE